MQAHAPGLVHQDEVGEGAADVNAEAHEEDKRVSV
jgi:hypothetical protein